MDKQNGYYGVDTASFREKGDSVFQSFAIELVPGQVCQLKCTSCYKRGNNIFMTRGNTPTDSVKSFIDQAEGVGFSEIVLMGGEPTLHPSIFELLRYVREQKGLTPILCTNGMKFADEREAAKLDGIRPTVVAHGYFPGGEDVIDQYSGKRGYAEVLKRAIGNLAKVDGGTLVLEMPLTDLMFPHAFTFFQYCRESGIIPFVEISRSNDSGGSTSSITPEQVAELFGQFKEYDERYFPHLADKNITLPAYGNKCTMSITGLHVKNFGNGDFGGVYSCCAQGIKHGDLKEQSLSEILRSPTMSVFKDQDKYIVGPCKDCDIYALCKGGCRGEAYLKFGCPRASSPACHLISEGVRNNAALMAPLSCEGCPAENCDQCGIK